MPLFQLLDTGLFRPDHLSWVMAGLILFVIINVLTFSKRYLAGDRNRRRHAGYVLMLAMSVIAMAFADHLLLLLVAWSSSNLLLVRLMIHKEQWGAARNSGLLALKTFGLGFVFLALGICLLAQSTGTASISHIVTKTEQTPMRFSALMLIALAALTQSAAWPFHRWLISSLNSPTPVSALMHAGLVNGGGFLIVRFAPLYAAQPILLHGLFLAGLVTALVGTFWKLLQTDIKRMLACSTMGQMGFMLMQCGMGLFAPAISHLCWHGLFKAYLFLSVGSVVKEKRGKVAASSLSPLRILFACITGICGALTFAWISGTELGFADTGCLMPLLAFMVATQMAVGLLGNPLSAIRLIGVLAAGCGAAGLYGLSIRLIDSALDTLHVMQPQPMDTVYLVGFALIFLVWFAMLIDLPTRVQSKALWKRLYMAALNASQPHPLTVTATRTAYQS